MKSFLVIQTAFIGDVILALPVVQELKRIYPDANIDMLVRKGNEALLKNQNEIRTIFTFNKKESKLRALKNTIQLLRKNEYDEVINLQRFFSSGWITFRMRTKSRVGFDKNPLSFTYSKKVKHQLDSNFHEVERNLMIISHHGAVKKCRPILTLSKEIESVSHLQNEEYVCLSPASIWYTKQLPKEKWVELAKKISSTKKVYLTGGPNDVDLCESIVNEVNHSNCVSFAGKFTLLESAALFSKASMNYVNDSGPMHLCSATNSPTTVFYCSTIPDFGFGPLSDNARIIQVDEKLDCRPCGLHGFKSCPRGHFKCGKDIKIDIV